VQPVREGFVARDGREELVRGLGDQGPWIAFAPIFQITHSQLLKSTVPYLSQHFRIVTMDGRGNGRSDRPRGQDGYSFEHYYQDFVAVLDAAGADRVAVIGISATAMTALRLAGERPERVTHVIVAGGFAEASLEDEKIAARVRAESAQMRENWPGYLDWFYTLVFSEPHSTKPYEDGVRYGLASAGETVDLGEERLAGGRRHRARPQGEMPDAHHPRRP